MKIVDTVYLVAYFRSEDPTHAKAVEVIENLNEEVKVSEAALLEFDLLLKSRGFKFDERIEVWSILNGLVYKEYIEIVTPLDLLLTTYITSEYGLDYFDSLISAQCIIRGADPVTNDKEIIKFMDKRREVLNVMRKSGYI